MQSQIEPITEKKLIQMILDAEELVSKCEMKDPSHTIKMIGHLRGLLYVKRKFGVFKK